MKIEDITIDNMMENIFNSYAVKKKRKEIIDYYIQQFNTDLFCNDNADENITENDIRKKVDLILKQDKNSRFPYLKYSKTYYSKARKKSTIIQTPNIAIDDNYIGKGGECAVMGELLFHGYNVNNMMVDSGIDLVASKDNVFYYIQVKTTTVQSQNRFYFKITRDRFDAFIGTQIRYFLVARCSFKNEDRNIFFQFSNNDIQRLLFESCIPAPAQGSIYLSIKIEYDDRTGSAYIYDGKSRSNVTFNMNNFNLN